MLCALTVRKLKPGSMEDFKRAFIPSDEMEAPPGWKRFYAIRNVADENEVVTFGFFDGTLEELRAGQQDNAEYDRRRAATEEFVESVGADGIFEVVEERSMEQLTELDRGKLDSGGIRWRNRVQFTRLALRKRGLLKPDSPRGVWELTDEGRKAAKASDTST